MAAAITTVGAITTAAIGAYMRNRELKLRLDQAKQEIAFQRDALDITGFVGDWEGLMSELKSLMQDTGIDRFLLLRAWNGALDPHYTSAVFQLHEVERPMLSYIHVELDQDYVERLRKMTTGGPIVFKTDAVDDHALIRGIYENEGVTESMWAHVETLSVGHSTAKAITYCSFATSHPEGINQHARTRANLVVGRLKGLAHNFSQVQE